MDLPTSAGAEIGMVDEQRELLVLAEMPIEKKVLLLGRERGERKRLRLGHPDRKDICGSAFGSPDCIALPRRNSDERCKNRDQSVLQDAAKTHCSALADRCWRPTSGPIPKFASFRGTFSCELRNPRTTSNSMLLVPLRTRSLRSHSPLGMRELRVRGTSAADLKFPQSSCQSVLKRITNFGNGAPGWLPAQK